MRAWTRDVTGERYFVASAAAREVAGSLHQMLPDSRRARVRIDHDIFHDRERLQRMAEVRNDDHMAGADELAGDLGHEDGVIAIARKAIEGGGELRLRDSQAQVIL